ncbi:phenylacetic acid degradation b [Pontibacter sp. SGAir0037]|uniref:phenylacetic acid degradation b n=1 Tax=Pontibacter sp. SGAir0037 TaxID=2571030 RepID=UPI0010CD00F3|nr:phenylacetic acid degradation b [Pontibacter sp. SGAir0037]QCR22922.1 phenylacetic acid degradation b [Pontibacter sp. SGAir0037]
MLTSLDPRVTRLHLPDNDFTPMEPKQELDQFETYEVFYQKRENSPYTYVGPVHAPTADIAFLFAKEQYSRRASCAGMWVTRTTSIQVTPYAGDGKSVYTILHPEDLTGSASLEETYEIFHLKKRGKAHTRAGRVVATSYQQALKKAKEQFGDLLPVVNVWVVKTQHVLQSAEEDKDMWATLPEKKYREPTAYKVLDKISKFKEAQKNTPD